MIQNILIKILAGEADVSEKQIFNRWIKEDEKNAQLFESCKKAWEFESGNRNVNADAAWKNICSKVKFSEEFPCRKNSKKNKVKYFYIGMAATLLILIGVSLVLFKDSGDNKYQLSYENTTSEPIEVNLPDSSKVILDTSAKIKLGEDFLSGKREIFLEGLAYFDIAKNENEFVVWFDNAKVTVTGTEFQVNTNSKISVVEVFEGSVILSSKDEKPQKVSLQPQEKAILKSSSPDFYKAKSGINSKYWISKQIVFKHTEVEEVEKCLEKIFSTEIEKVYLTNNKLRISGVFKDENLVSIIQKINDSFELDHPGKQLFMID